MITRALTLSVLSVAAAAQSWVAVDGPRLEHGNVAYDTRRQRAVAVDPAGEVWEHDGVRWLHRPLATGAPRPTPRTLAAVVYDAARGHVLVFGGGARSGLALGDTWTWDGVAWRQLPVFVTPPRRYGAAIAYDAARQRVVMFGGADGVLRLTDTWEHDGARWRQVPTAVDPGWAPNLAMAPAPQRPGVVVAVVGADTWEWDGSVWSVVPATRPLRGGSGGVLVRDARRGRVCWLGGNNLPGDEVWEWDGAQWSLAGRVPEFDRLGASAWFDSVLGEVVAGGGLGAGSRLGDSWRWNGTRAVLHERRQPSLDELVGAFWSPGVERVVKLTRHAGATQAWSWDGHAWSAAGGAAAGTPQLIAAEAAADLGGGATWLFGWTPAGTSELWRYANGQWSGFLAAGPSARFGMGLAFDAARGDLVLFGGTDNARNNLGDTWTWDGQSWSQRQPAQSPPARLAMAMTFSPALARTVMYGGRRFVTSGSGRLFDTWEWDGQSWSQVLTATNPMGRDPAMAFDAGRGRVVMADLVQPVPPSLTYAQGLWDYDGVDWSPRGQADVEGDARLVYDWRRGRLVSTGEPLLEETPTAAEVDTVGPGCGVLPARLAVRTRARIGQPGFGLEVDSRPGAAALFALATSQGTTPGPGSGCVVHVGAPAATALWFCDARGLAELAVGLPFLPALRGVQVFAQAGVVDAAGNLGLSPGLRIVVGD